LFTPPFHALSRLTYAVKNRRVCTVNDLERDTERGYSINVKQVVLAFAVEFVIIALILANQSAIAALRQGRV
jgi:hypothetical protein